MIAGRTLAARSFDPSVPMHHQLFLILRNELADGLWVGRDDFPGERELAEQAGVGVVTSRTALDRLAGEGWIERRRGHRPKVLHVPADRPTPTSTGLVPMPAFNDPYRYTVLNAVTGVAPAQGCAAFGLPPGSRLWQCLRLRSLDGSPHSVTLSAHLPATAELLDHTQLSRRSMAEILTRAGVSIRSMRRTMGIAHATPAVADALGLHVTDMVLVVTLTLRDQGDDTVEWVRIHLRPDLSTPEEVLDLETGTWSTDTLF